MKIILNHEITENFDKLKNHFLALSKNDRYSRFLNTKSDFSVIEWLKEYPNPRFTTIFFVKENEQGDFVGVLQLSIFVGGYCEVAVSVLETAQRSGIASELLQEAIAISFNYNIKEMSYQCLMDNDACKKLFIKHGFSVHYDPDILCMCGSLFNKVDYK